jgi:flagellar basal body rod protein FlgG
MLQGLSSNVTGINAYKNTLITSAHNVANINTPAFKSNTLQLSELKNGGMQVASIRQSDLQSYSINSGRPLDFYINGDGYFKLDDNGEDYFTRKGNFYLDAAGSLVDERGRILMEDVVEPGDKLDISDDGGVYVNGEERGFIGLFNKNGEEFPRENVDIRSGALEASDVDYAREVVNMIAASRSIESNITSMRTHDDLLGLIVNLKG